MEKTRVQGPPMLEKETPDPNTDFGDETFDESAMPQNRVSIGGFNEWLFGLMRPKSKISAKLPIKRTIAKRAGNPPDEEPQRNPVDGHTLNLSQYVPEGYEVQNGLIIKTKTLAERVRDQIKFPVLKSSQSMVNGAALVIFAVGAYTLYSQLPTRPDLVVGILLVIIAGNIITSNR
jgi:hypothetical protein